MHHYTELPLHNGNAPRWLFERMVKLGREISLVIIDEFGPDEFINRLSDAVWFQALSCALGYDWHSSGTTTVTMGVLKEALNSTGEIFIAGGKGKVGLRTPQEIEKGVDILSIPGSDENFKMLSRLSAKIDSALVYDNIGIYHHTFIFSKNKKWAVIQQAIDSKNKKAIRFQWNSDIVSENDLADEPHSAIISDLHNKTLNLTNKDNNWARSGSLDAIKEFPYYSKELSITRYPSRHDIVPKLDISKRGSDAIKIASDINPSTYNELLLIKGMGRSTLRSLAFIASLIYDKELSYKDPVMYSYNLGEKMAYLFLLILRSMIQL
ncbi:MAG: DUF763 domain-containing protein [Candidatus Micrarchaeia archaeon]